MRAPVAQDMARLPYTDEAAKIVRSCVHCGFCNATCPTYQLSGDELEGPRGRIYLIKALLEEGQAGEHTRRHLDQCLLCRNCETTCPSGVNYGRLIELVRPQVNAANPLPWYRQWQRWLLAAVVPYPARFGPLVALGRAVKPLLPKTLASKLPNKRPVSKTPTTSHERRVLLLGGCAQAVLSPALDVCARRVFDRLGIELVSLPQSGCCGALSSHLGYRAAAVQMAKNNIDAWWPEIERGAEAVMATSSGCGVQLKDYVELLDEEPGYAERAQRVQDLARDPIELVDAKALAQVLDQNDRESIVFQSPCTLQHGQRLAGQVEALLTELGWPLQTVTDGHLCCGSAGSYSVLHPATSQQLGAQKLASLMAASPAVIVTANIGCELHLGALAPVPVRHWLEFIAGHLSPG